MTRGILDPATYYYRRVFTDAVRAVEAARAHPGVDPTRVAVTGGSQGGGISIAAASLVPDVAAVMPDVPFLADFERAITITDKDPYTEVARYLKAHRDHTDRVLRTLGYMDVANLGRRATAPALFSVGLMDEICPPSTVYAAYNEYGGPKEIVEYPFNDHEGGAGFHDIAKMRWLAERFGTSPTRSDPSPSVEVEDLLEALVEPGRGIGQRVDERCHLGLPAVVDRCRRHRTPGMPRSRRPRDRRTAHRR